MKKNTILAISFLLLSYVSNGQNNKQTRHPENAFRHPVLAKIIQGEGNVFRIGFMRHNDFHDIKEDEGNAMNIYANFMSSVGLVNSDLTDKFFIYFPLSDDGGEMMIMPKSQVQKLDMTYEQAIKLIRPEQK